MTTQKFIRKRPYLVWSTRNYEELSDESIVEAVLNYGNWEDVKEIIKIMGIKKVAAIFRKKSQVKRKNYDSKIKNYFQLYFAKYA